MIRLMVPDIEPEDIEAVAGVLRSGMLVQGEQVAAFESLLCATLRVEHTIALSSGTAALHLGLLALNLGPGDAVAVPAYTWPATANVVALTGAEPVFVDIEPKTWGMDPAELRRALEGNPRIKAVMPVHAFGQIAEIGRIAEAAAAFEIPIVEDAACALGAELEGRAAGTFGILGCFSFHPRKVLTTGEGGAVVTDDPRLAARIRVLRNHGMRPGAPAPDFVEPGFNLRMTEFQAALGTGQLRRLADILARRRAVAEVYHLELANTVVEACPPRHAPAHTYQSYVVLLPSRGRDRNGVIAALRGDGIETTVGTHHVPLTAHFRQRYGYAPGDFPVTDDIANRALTLPLHRDLGEAGAKRVAAALLARIG